MNVSFTQFIPAVIAVATVIGTAFVANSTISRHDREIEAMREKVQDLETAVAVIKAMMKGGE